MPDWFDYRDLLVVSSVVSSVLFVASLLAIPVLCVRLPADYFVSPVPKRAGWLIALRTLAAVFLLAVGSLMLVLPGQGVLTILLGVSLLDFPAKRQLERKLLQRGPLLRAINRIRAKARVPPLRAP
jgi:hypothetical protein